MGPYKKGDIMKTKKYLTWVLVSVAFLLVIAVYQAEKFAGENSEELAFLKEKEATRKAEFAKLQKIYEEEKRAEEKRRREEKREESGKELFRSLEESSDARYRMLFEILMQQFTEFQATVPDYLLNDYPAAMSTKDSPVSSPATKAQGGKTYINAGGGHWVSKNIDHGKYIKLEDGSL